MIELPDITAVTFINPEKRDATLERLRQLFGINLQRVVKWATEPPTYSVFIDDREVALGNVDGLLNQTRFRRAILSVADRLPKLVHKDYWDSTVNMMVDAMEVVPVALTSQLEDYQRWLEMYLAKHPVTDEARGGDDWDRALELLRPVCNAMGVWIHTPAFQLFLWESQRENISHREIAKHIKAFGGIAKQLRGKKNRNVRPTYYLLPPVLTPDYLMPEEVRL